MTKAYSYRRFSNAEQKQGRSADRQMEACQAWCTANGIELATGKEHTFLDEGKSAYRGEQLDEANGQLARFIRRVEDKSIPAGSYLVVENLDRLGRDKVKDAWTRFTSLLDKGINIVTLSDGKVYKDGYTTIDLMMSILTMARAHDESSMKAARLGDVFRKKQQDAREHKKPMGSAIPLWLRFSNGVISVDDDAVAVVKRIFDMAIAGWGATATAKALNEDGVKAFKARRFDRYEGVAWGKSSVMKILRNRSVLGEYQPYSSHKSEKREKAGDSITDYFPVVIGEDVFYKAQDAISKRLMAKVTKQSKNFNVFQGIAKCETCASAMHLVNKGKAPKGATYLHCSSARKGLCKAKAVRLNKCEAVFRQMLARLDSVALVQDNAGKITAQLDELGGRLTERQALYKKMSGTLRTRFTDALNDIVFDLEQEIKGLRAQQEQLKKALANERVGSFAEFLEKVDLESYEGRSRANTLCKRLEVVVYIGKGWFVTEHGKWVLTFVWKDGAVGQMVMEGDDEYISGAGGSLVDGIYGLMDEGWAYTGSDLPTEQTLQT